MKTAQGGLQQIRDLSDEVRGRAGVIRVRATLQQNLNDPARRVPVRGERKLARDCG